MGGGCAQVMFIELRCVSQASVPLREDPSSFPTTGTAFFVLITSSPFFGTESSCSVGIAASTLNRGEWGLFFAHSKSIMEVSD